MYVKISSSGPNGVCPKSGSFLIVYLYLCIDDDYGLIHVAFFLGGTTKTTFFSFFIFKTSNNFFSYKYIYY